MLVKLPSSLLDGNAPTKGAVILFLLVSILAVMLAAGSAVFSVVIVSSYIGTSNHQWCTYLEQVTAVKPPEGTPAQPGRVYEYRLYENFLQLKANFGCD